MLDINYSCDESPETIVDIISRCQKYDYNNFDGSIFDYNFSILNLSIRSIKFKLNELDVWLTNLSCKPSVICLSETWCQTTSPIASLSGYNIVSLPRLNRKGGVVCMCISNHIRFAVVNMPVKFCMFENLAILIEINTKQVLCVTAYNPSSSACDFYDEFTVLLENFGRMFASADNYLA